MHKTPKIGFKTLVNTFSLAIYLWVVCTTHSYICVKQFEQLLPNIAGEDFISIRNHNSGKAMKFKDVIQINHCHLESSEKDGKEPQSEHIWRICLLLVCN